MPTRGLLVDHAEAQRKGISFERAEAEALERFKTRPLVQQLVDLEFFIADFQTKFAMANDNLTEEQRAEFVSLIDEHVAMHRRLEKIYRRNNKTEKKQRTKTDVARTNLINKLREFPAHVPTEGDAPINKKSREIKQFLDDYDRREAANNDPALAHAGATNHELVENAFLYIYNLMENDFHDAKVLNISLEDIAKLYHSAHSMQARLDAEDRVRQLTNDTAPPVAKDAADMLLADMDAKGRKNIFLTPNDILGRKRGN